MNKRPSVLFAATAISLALLPAAQAQNQQSPIRFQMPEHPSSPTDHPPRLDFSYGNRATVNVVHNVTGIHRGIEIQVTDNANMLTIGGDSYRLKEVHFHHASEHRLAGAGPFAMEMHMKHYKVVNGVEQPNNPLVIGRWMTIGQDPDPALDTIYSVIITEPPIYTVATPPWLDVHSLIPALDDRGSWRYDGSLTTGDPLETPGNPQVYQEGIKWVFFRSELQISQSQFDVLTTIIGDPNVRDWRNPGANHHLTWDIPAPGAASLFMIAGVVAMRRRRIAA